MSEMAFLFAELRRLDLLLYREVLRLRAAYELSPDEFRGLYISDEQVDALLTQGDLPFTPQELSDQAEELRQSNLDYLEEEGPWLRLVDSFGLTCFEQDVLLLVLAPELDLKYENIYAYLNNDIARKFPTVELALRLFAPPAATRTREQISLQPHASLLRHGLIEAMAASADRPHWLGRGLLPAPVVLRFLLGDASVDPDFERVITFQQTMLDWGQLGLLDEQGHALRRASRFWQKGLNGEHKASAPAIVLVGRAGGRQEDAAALLCQEMGMPLLRVDLAHGRAAGLSPLRLAASLNLYRRLWRVALYLDHGEALFAGETGGTPLAEAHALLDALCEQELPLFLVFPSSTAWREVLEGYRYLPFFFGDPDFVQRSCLWRHALDQAAIPLTEVEIESLANRFILSPSQINATIVAAQDHRRVHGEKTDEDEDAGEVGLAGLVEAARSQSGQSLARLAIKVSSRHSWDDLVLPSETQQRIQEIAAAIRHQHIVYAQWGFSQRISAGKGLKVLFAGASGTGKTMTAGVIARDAGLDLYKVDLSGVVSKYIGETEKNLEAIFRAAYGSNAILFFDEADALFGKRSEVKDAHDRYANIEVSYLLQRMEQHEGTVILASNLGKNIDEAFSRRMHYVVEFPLPDEMDRERLWRGIFPAQAPLGQDVDLPFLARQFVIAGGDIQNVALDSAFLAAQNGGEITMQHLTQAMARQMLKQGRIPSPADFRHYFGLLSQE